jgi:hypothetical protein
LTLFSSSIFAFSEKEEEAKHGEKLFRRPRLLPKSLMSSSSSPLNAKKIRERILFRRHRLADDHEEEEEEDGAKEKYISFLPARQKK